MDVNLFDYHLPEELIAQTPLPDRSASKLMVLRRREESIEHHHFYELPELLQAGDVLVMNDSKVIPARLHGIKEKSGALIEVLLLKQISEDVWETLVRPGKRVKEGTKIGFGDGELAGTCEGVLPDGNRLIRFSYTGIFQEILAKLGEMPLPPYIHEKLEDPDRYQTVYAKEEGSAAAPTAGLHFTQEILDRVREKGIKTAFLTLHVGLGTFRPVSVRQVEEHKMHAEYYELDEENAALIQEARERGGRVVAVGTTSLRTLETIAGKWEGRIVADHGWTDIFIYPGYTFRGVDALITNFHLPKSTLMMLVSAFAGREYILRAYEEAIRMRYRFFSFGDAMLIL